MLVQNNVIKIAGDFDYIKVREESQTGKCGSYFYGSPEDAFFLSIL